MILFISGVTMLGYAALRLSQGRSPIIFYPIAAMGSGLITVAALVRVVA